MSSINGSYVHYLLLLLLSLPAFAATNWKSDVEALMEDSSNQPARSRLEKNKQLDQELAAAIQKGGSDERAALEGIRLLERTALASELLKKIQPMDLREVRAQMFFLTLASLTLAEKGNDTLNALKKKADLSSDKVPAPVKLALLQTMIKKVDVPSPQQLFKLLDDENYDLREAAAAIVERDIQVRPKEHLAFLHKALTLSPYTLRLKAVDTIGKLPTEQKKDFVQDIKHCAANDQNEVVKTSCHKIKI